jgi:hypothetical protein
LKVELMKSADRFNVNNPANTDPYLDINIQTLTGKE